MCWNCGCMMPDDDMGNKDNITTESLRRAARAGGNKNLQELMANVVRTYEAKIKSTAENAKPVR